MRACGLLRWGRRVSPHWSRLFMRAFILTAAAACHSRMSTLAGVPRRTEPAYTGEPVCTGYIKRCRLNGNWYSLVAAVLEIPLKFVVGLRLYLCVLLMRTTVWLSLSSLRTRLLLDSHFTAVLRKHMQDPRRMKFQIQIFNKIMMTAL